MRAVDLNAATRDLLAPVCRSCTWWQAGIRAGEGSDVRAQWESAVEHEAGMFGRALVDGERVLGWMQAAPGALVPRAHRLPAGPPSSDAWLLTCAYLLDEECFDQFERLLLELEAALKQRRVGALEAFALRRAPASAPRHGYIRRQNLFHPEALEGGGFRTVSTTVEVARYRLDLTAIAAATRYSRAQQRVERGTATQPV